jgi:hypothetical protein
VTAPGKEDEMADMSTSTQPPAGTPSEEVEDVKPFWPVAAAFLAAGFGVLVLGVLTTLAEASTTIKDWLQFSDQVGPLSGKTLVSVAAWLVAWAALTVALRGRQVAPRTVYWLTGLLVALGLIGTFPSFFEQFAPE